jgi:hypothetical protein
MQSDWNYYTNISRENSLMASRVRNLTSSPVTEKEGNIPHRLIFTHYTNLLDCDNSASNTSSPPLYNLAENVKATIKAYQSIWEDLEYVFLTDGECVNVVKEVLPDLAGWLNNPMLQGEYRSLLTSTKIIVLF